MSREWQGNYHTNNKEISHQRVTCVVIKFSPLYIYLFIYSTVKITENSTFSKKKNRSFLLAKNQSKYSFVRVTVIRIFKSTFHKVQKKCNMTAQGPLAMWFMHLCKMYISCRSAIFTVCLWNFIHSDITEFGRLERNSIGRWRTFLAISHQLHSIRMSQIEWMFFKCNRNFH